MKKILLNLIYVFLFSHSVFGQLNSDFTVDRYNVCSGTSLTLTNTSTGADFYEWKIEGSHYSYSQDTVVTLVEPCYDLKEIKLIAMNTVSGFSDSSSTVVEVFDSCYFHWIGDYNWCIGDTVRMPVNPEEIATQFVITPPQTLLSGCLTCPSLEFILVDSNTIIDRTSTYLGGCTEVTSYHSSGCNPIVSVSINEETSMENVKIFPNPANQIISIEAESSIEKILIYNALGQILFKSNDINDIKTKIDISHFTIGIYHISVGLENGKIAKQKIIKN
ncbi:MAG: T9SS type A sorting domain-containing protein [Crocinitomicaceae bacterium]